MGLVRLPRIAVERRPVTYFIVFLIVLAGAVSFFELGQLEDPEYTVKTAVIVTEYPGASPTEVELEVTDIIEQRIQEMKQIKWIKSRSSAGESLIKVEMLPIYWGDELQQVWDELRRKVREVETHLPPGAGRPRVHDDYGDVFGFQLALIGDGFSYAEMERYAKDLRKELSVVDGVARVDLWGAQPKVVYVDVSETQLSQLGLSEGSIERTVESQNLVVDSGALDVQNKRFRIQTTGEFTSPRDIENLNIRATLIDQLGNLIAGEGRTRQTQPSAELITIGDIGSVVPGYQEPASKIMHFNGRPAIGISITNLPGVNIVDVGRAIDRRIDELAPTFPVGIEIARVHWQSDIVAEAVNGFLINFAEALAIVLAVLTLFMGWRMGLIIGSALVVTILGTFIFMALFKIDLQRMSLGALVIALGMMVDNAIVVADGMVVRLQKGMDRVQAAVEAASQPSMALLGATLVAVMAFYPIYASPQSTGEYCKSLFEVVGISLLVSWLVSVTLTPLQCIDMLSAPTGGASDPYRGKFYQSFRGALRWAIRGRVFTLGGMVVLLVVAVIGFGNVEQLFFPDSSMSKFMIDYRAPAGTRIQTVAADLEEAEKKLLEDERVASVTTYIGSGPPRFYLPVEPEDAYPSYAQLIVNVHEFRQIDALIEDLHPWFTQHYPQAQVPIRKFAVGPGRTWKFEIRISGPAIADAGVLRKLGAEGVAILDSSPYAGASQTDWRQRVQKVVADYSQQRGRYAGVTREDIGKSTLQAFDGRRIGLYRRADDLIPILLRYSPADRRVGSLAGLQVQPSLTTKAIPLGQVTSGTEPEWEDPFIWRRNRRRTIQVQSNPVLGETLPTLQAAVAGQFEDIELPAGYTMEWSGEIEDTADSQQALIPGIVPSVIIMLLIIVMLYNAYRPAVIIVLTIPFAAIGITAGLLTFDVPFGFMSLLGAMSLAGMMIKNAIVLLDEVNNNLAAGSAPYDAVVGAAVSRLRPVVLAAATTVLGVVPLLQDVFWVGMAVTIMAGLAFGTVLTMVLVPTLYATLYRIRTAEA